MNISLRRFLGKVFRSSSERRHAHVGPAHLWKMKREFQFNFLELSGLEPQHDFLDIGCGTLRGGIPLIEFLETGRYCGLEVRAEVLAEGRSELAAAGLEGKHPQLVVPDDMGALELGRKFDYAWAFSVLFHMTDEIVEQCVGMVARHLEPDGVLYANVNIGDRPPGDWQGFPVMYHTLEFYQELCRRHGMSAQDTGSLETLGHISGDAAQDSQRMLAIKPV